MSKTAFSNNLRNVDVVVQPDTDVSAPLGAYKACLDFVERVEMEVAKGVVSDLRDFDVVGGTDIILTDLNQNVWYVVTVVTMAAQTGEYSFTILADFPSLEEAEAALA